MPESAKQIYLDNAAATSVDSRVLEAMQPYWSDFSGNPSSLYFQGRLAKTALEKARLSISKILNCLPDEIIFTAGGTESDNLAVLGIARYLCHKASSRSWHIITSSIEHHAVLRPFEYLEREEGFRASYLPVDEFGLVDLKVLEKEIKDGTVLVSIMYANNEIGTVEPIGAAGRIIKKIRQDRKNRGIEMPLWFHTDACQAAGALNLDVQNLGVDLLTLNGSKIYGPKQAGLLYVRKGVQLEPIIFGGGQEKKLRSGTENIPAIIGLAKALEIVQAEKEKENQRLIKLREKLIKGILQRIPKAVLNGHPTERLPNNANISILDIEGEAVLFYLDEAGIMASTGSACTSESLDPSHVILALGKPYEFAHGSLRFTLGKETTEADIDYVLEVLPLIAEKLRSISPVKTDIYAKNMNMPQAFAGLNMEKFKNKKIINE